MNTTSLTIKKGSIIDIPQGWGDTVEEFKKLVVLSIKHAHLGAKAPKYDIVNPDGTITPFYPIFCAVSPEWGIITRQEIYDILRPKFVERAMGLIFHRPKAMQIIFGILNISHGDSNNRYFLLNR